MKQRNAERSLKIIKDTYLFLLLVEVVNDDTNKQVQREKWTKNDEDDEVQVHKYTFFPTGLGVLLQKKEKSWFNN